MSVDRKKIGTYVFLVLVIGYFIVSFALPSNRDTLVRYHLTSLSLRLLDLTVVVPIAIIWSLSYYGFYHLNNYVSLINNNKDGRELKKISQGLGILAFGQITKAIISAILAFIAQDHSSFTAAYTIINNYLGVLVPLIAFLLISNGAYGLAVLVKARSSHVFVHFFTAVLIVIGILYCYLVFNNSLAPQLSNTPSPNYHLPNLMILITLVVPYIFVWFTGISAAYQIYMYEQKVPGKIYKKSMKYISLGISAIIILLVALQYLTTLTNRLLELKISSLLIIIYPLLILMSVGYILVAIGAKKLQKIEEI